jgi:hypothetical protein
VVHTFRFRVRSTNWSTHDEKPVANGAITLTYVRDDRTDPELITSIDIVCPDSRAAGKYVRSGWVRRGLSVCLSVSLSLSLSLSVFHGNILQENDHARYEKGDGWFLCSTVGGPSLLVISCGQLTSAQGLHWWLSLDFYCNGNDTPRLAPTLLLASDSLAAPL